MRLFTAISAVVFLSFSVPALAEDGYGTRACSPIGAIGCPKDCNRLQPECRRAYPYPADRSARNVFRKIAGSDRRMTTEDLARVINRRDNLFFKVKFNEPYKPFSGKHRQELESIARHSVDALDVNRDGWLSEDEALRFSASFYNQFSGDTQGGFFRPEYWDAEKQEYIVPRNQASAPYSRKDQ